MMTIVNVMPPSNGNNNSISFNGRTYSSRPGVAIPVPDFDAPVLQANGWTLAALGSVGERWAARLRRLHRTARGKNPIELPFLIGSVGWTISTAYALAAVVSLGGNVYRATVAGTSAASGGPTGFGSAIVDNTVTWAYVGPQTAPVVLANQATHDAALSNIKLAADSLVDNKGGMRFRGGTPTLKDTNPTYVAMVAANVLPNPASNWGVGLNTVHSSATTIFEGVKLEIQLFPLAQNFAISVDGRYIDSTPFNGTGGGGRFHTLDFTNVVAAIGPVRKVGRARRVITIEWGTQVGLQQMATESTGTINYPEVGDNFSVAYVGDSQVGGAGEISSFQPQNFTLQLAHLLGLPDMMACGIGSTGFVVPGASSNFIGHAISDMKKLDAFRPLKYAFVQISTNDPFALEVNLTELRANILGFCREFRRTFPEAPLFVVGIVTGGSMSAATVASRETTMLGAVAELRAEGDGLIFGIPAATDAAGPWVTGTGTIAAPNGTGSADFNISTDGVHLSAAGHALWARKVASAVPGICGPIA